MIQNAVIVRQLIADTEFRRDFFVTPATALLRVGISVSDEQLREFESYDWSLSGCLKSGYEEEHVHRCAL